MEFKGLGITFICNRCLKEIQISVDLPISARQPETPFPCNILYTMRRNHHNCFLCYNCYNFVKQLLHETNTLNRYPIPKFLHVNPARHKTGLTHAEYRLRNQQSNNVSYITHLCSLIVLANTEAKLIERDNLNQNLCPIAPQVQTPAIDLWNSISSDNRLLQPTSESNEFVSVEMIPYSEEWKPQFKLKSCECVGDEMSQKIRDREPQLTLESNDLVSVEISQNVEEGEQHSNNLFSTQPKLKFTELFAVDVEECDQDSLYESTKSKLKSYKFAEMTQTITESEPHLTLESNDLVSIEMIQNVEECESQPTLQSNNLFNLNMMLARLELDEFIAAKKNPRVTERESQPTLESDQLGREITEHFDELDLQTIDLEELFSDEDIELYKPQARLESREFTTADLIQNVEEDEPTFESSEAKLKLYQCVEDEITQSISEREPQLTLASNDLVSVEVTENIEECESQPILHSNQSLAKLESSEFVAVNMIPRESEDVISVEMIENVEAHVSQPKLNSVDITQSDKECKNQTSIEELISIELMENIEVCESQSELKSEEFVNVEMYVGEYDTQPMLESNEVISSEETNPQAMLKPDKFLNIKMTENVLVYEHQPVLQSDVSVSVEIIQNLVTQPSSESGEFIDVIQSVEEPAKKSDEFISVEIQNTEEYELQLVDEDKSTEFIRVQIIENPKDCQSQATLQSSEFVSIEMIQNVEDCELQSRVEVDELDIDVMQNIVTCEPQLTLESDELVTSEIVQNIEECEQQPREEADELNVNMIQIVTESETQSHKSLALDWKTSEIDDSILNLEECKSNTLDNTKTIRTNEESDRQPKMESDNDPIENIKELKTTYTFNEMFPNVEEQTTSDSDEFSNVKMLPVIGKCKHQHKLRSGEAVGVEMINEDYDQSDTDSHRTYVIDFVPYVRRPRVCWEVETLSDEEYDDAKIFWAWKRRCPVEHELRRSPGKTNLQISNAANVQQEENEASVPADVQDSPERLWLEDITGQSENNTTTLEVWDNENSRLQLEMLEEPWSPRARIQDWIFTHATTSGCANTRTTPDSNDWILKNHKFRRSTNKPPVLMPPIHNPSDLPVTLVDISDESS